MDGQGKVKVDYVRLSKTMSHALRHEPERYGLQLDEAGWTSLAELLTGLRQHRSEWQALTEADVQAVLERPGKKRFERQGGRIRALYGHSVDKPVAKEAVEPPAFLYHGTTATTARIIRSEGLKPMQRQYVHLSTDRETAREVGRRRAEEPVILTIRAGAAYRDGHRFYHGNQSIWLADHVPPEYIEG